MAFAFDVLVCKRCLKVPLGAMDSECCHQLFCERCSARIAECSTCGRSPFRAAPSMIMRGSVVCTLASITCRSSQQPTNYSYVRSLLASMPIACDYCGVQVEMGAHDEHVLQCARRPRHCSVPACVFASNDPSREELALHVVRQHLELFDNKFVLSGKEGAPCWCTSHYSRHEIIYWSSWVPYSLLYECLSLN